MHQTIYQLYSMSLDRLLVLAFTVTICMQINQNMHNQITVSSGYFVANMPSAFMVNVNL